MLEDLLHADSNSVRLSQEVNADGSRFLAEACEIGLEGIIAKRRRTSYRPGRGGDWLKIKCITSETFLIVGYEPSSVALGGSAGCCSPPTAIAAWSMSAASAPASPYRRRRAGRVAGALHDSFRRPEQLPRETV